MDAVASCIPSWKGKMMNLADQDPTLAWVVLLAVLTHHLIALCLALWAMDTMDKLHRLSSRPELTHVLAGNARLPGQLCVSYAYSVG